LTRKSQMHIRFGRRKKMDDGSEVSDIAPKPEKPRKASRMSMRRPNPGTPSFMSKASMPKPVAGVVDDLRERGLLPVALVPIAAIVAVPFVLSSGAQPPADE